MPEGSREPAGTAEDDRRALARFGAWFFAANTVPCLLIALRYMKHIRTEGSLTVYLYALIATVSHFLLLAMLPYVLLYLPAVMAYPKRRFAKVVGVVVSVLGLAVLMLDTVIFDQYRFHINGFVLGLVFSGDCFKVFEFSYALYAVVFLFLGACAALECGLWFVMTGLTRARTVRRGYIVAIVWSVMMLSTHAIHVWADAVCHVSILRSSGNYPLFYPATANRFMRARGWYDEERAKENRVRFASQRHSTLNYPLSELRFAGRGTKNVLLIVVDCWRRDELGELNTPNIHRFSKRCTVFANHRSGSNGTRGSLFSVMYGVTPMVRLDFLSLEKGPVLIDTVLDQEYAVCVCSSAPLSSSASDRTSFSRVREQIPLMPGATAYERDVQATERWLGFTEEYAKSQNRRPFFGYVSYDSTHAFSLPPGHRGPFQPAWEYPKYLSLDASTDPTEFFNLHRNVVHAVDVLVGRILTDLETRGLLENTIVVICGDHGQEFNDCGKGYWGHGSNYSQAQNHVAFVYHDPGRAPGVSSAWTTHYDVAPTLLEDVFTCTSPPGEYCMGSNLFGPPQRTWHVAGNRDDFAVILPDRMITVDKSGLAEITDHRLDPVPGAKLDAELIGEVMKAANKFYK